jgi:hypothetical protein
MTKKLLASLVVLALLLPLKAGAVLPYLVYTGAELAVEVAGTSNVIQFPLAAMAGGTAADVATAGAGWLASVQALGVGALALLVGGDAISTKAKVQVSSTPLPAPSAPQTVGSTQTYQYDASAYSIYSGYAATPAAAAAAWLIADYVLYPNGHDVICNVFDTYFTFNSPACGSGDISVVINKWPTQVCGSAYSLSGGTCNLKSAFAPSNGLCDWLKNSSSWSVDPNDPDCVATHVPAFTKNTTGDQIDLPIKGPSGTPANINVTALPDGGAKVTQTYQAVDAGGNSQTVSLSLSFGADGSVTNSGQTTSLNTSLQQNPTTGAYTPVATGGNLTAPVGAAPAAIVFPNDYSREATSARAASASEAIMAKQCGGTGQVACKVDVGPDPGTPAPILESTPTGSAIFAPLAGLFGELKAFQVPAHTSTCGTTSFTAFGQVRNFDQMCTLFSGYSGLLSSAMLTVWVVVATFIILRA